MNHKLGYDDEQRRLTFFENCLFLGTVNTASGVPDDTSRYQPCLSAALFPKYVPDQVIIHPFKLLYSDLDEWSKKAARDKDALCTLLNWNTGVSVKGLMLVTGLGYGNMGKYVKHVIELLNGEEAESGNSKQIEQPKFAIAGGIADTACVIESQSRDKKDIPICGIIFGGERLRCASILLNREVNTKVKTREVLGRLRREVDTWPTGRLVHKVGFVFVCCGRGVAWHKDCRASEKNVEAGLLQEMFPDTQFTGMFSLGEFGCDYLSSFGGVSSADAKRPKVSIEFEHKYTTTVMIVGF